MDAWGALNASFGNLWKATAEINESLYPHVQWSRDYRTDSGGPGQWRGVWGGAHQEEDPLAAHGDTHGLGMKNPLPRVFRAQPRPAPQRLGRFRAPEPALAAHPTPEVR